MPDNNNTSINRPNVLVTGASGFIGRCVIRELQKQDVSITAITRDRSKLKDLLPESQILESDILNEPNKQYYKAHNPDILIHLAWDNLNNYQANSHIKTTLPAHYQFIKTQLENGLGSVFVAGTCFEYGMQSGSLNEDAPTLPTLPYAIAKDTLRKNLQNLQKNISFNLVWGRLFYMYGEEQAKNSLYSQFKDAVNKKEKIFNMSAGEQLRDYLPVEQVARLIYTLSLSRKNIGIINICSGEPISVKDLVRQWLKEFNSEMELNLGYYPYPDYEPMSYWGNNNKLIQFLG